MTGSEGQVLFRPFRIAVTITCTLTLPAIVMPSSPHNSQGAGAAAPPLPRVVRVGRNPFALAVDARAGRVFVLDGGTGTGANYALTDPGYVSVLDATTGAVVRTVAVGRGLQAVAVDAATGRAFVTDQARVYTLDARTGAVLRTLPIAGGPTGGLVVDARHGEVFVVARGVDHGPAGRGPGGIVVLDAATGQTRRTIHAYGDPLAVDDVARRIILPYACGDTPGVADLCVDTLDAVTGRRIKTADLSSQNGYPQGPSAVAVDARAGRAFVLYGDGRGDANIGALATRTGVGQGLVGDAAGSSGTIVVDEQAGRAIIATTPDNYAAGSGPGPAVAAIATVLDTHTENDLASVMIPNNVSYSSSAPVGVAVDTKRGYAFVVATPNGASAVSPPKSTLVVLDVRGGRVLHRLALPHAIIPSGLLEIPMAVDDQTGRLFIADGTNNTVSVLDTARL